ncbi:MAG TPA: conjugal transfer protein TraF [Vicinamibacterales bacterium]|nr:conjugal transfer protein TraF [Vicinamibacterales bacterium]
MVNDRFVARVAIGAVLLAIAVVSSTAFVAWWQLRARATHLSYVVGETIDVPSRLYAQAERTLILFVRASCDVCQAEAPALMNMVDRLKAFPTAVPTVVVTGSASPDPDREFARSFRNAAHEHIAFETLKVRTVPTIVLVDHRGAILFAQEGRPKALNSLGELIQRIPSR